MGRRQFTVTVAEEIGRYLEERSRAEGVTKSAVVSRALDLDRFRRQEELLEEGYREMAEHDRRLAEEFTNLDASTPWPDY